jgi:hypothetical protein
MLDYFWEGAATEISEKVELMGFVFGAHLYDKHEMFVTVISFLFVKKE